MFFALAYIAVAGSGALVAHAIVRRVTGPNLGVAYLRVSLGVSASLVAIDLLVFVIFGVWPMPLGAAVVIGLLWPGVMMTIT